VPSRVGLPQSLLPAPRQPRIHTETPVLDEIDALIEAYEIDISCARCRASLRRSISWLQNRYVMNCPDCDSVIVLGTSTMAEEIRRISRRMRELQLQLVERVGKANAILGR
jgi:hypothetical protein